MPITSDSLPRLSTFLDSGAPAGSTDYTTIVIVHGLMWHGANFKRLVPLASHNDARVIAVNRLEYPGSSSHSDADVALLTQAAAAPAGDVAASEDLQTYWRNRARDVFDYLASLVRSENIPAVKGTGKDAKGGIVLAGWSFGVVWMTALLAHIANFAHSDIALSHFVRRVVLYDGSYYFLGQPHPPVNVYHPFQDPTLTTMEERVAAFDKWVVSYYPHEYPVTPEGLARAAVAPLTAPPPTEPNVAEARHAPPGQIHERDMLVFQAAMTHGIYASLKNLAFYPPASEKEQGVDGREDWTKLEVKYVWCDQSIWEMPWGVRLFQAEVEQARSEGRMMRDIQFVRFRGANHFAHWDLPEKTMRMFLGHENEVA